MSRLHGPRIITTAAALAGEALIVQVKWQCPVPLVVVCAVRRQKASGDGANRSLEEHPVRHLSQLMEGPINISIIALIIITIGTHCRLLLPRTLSASLSWPLANWPALLRHTRFRFVLFLHSAASSTIFSRSGNPSPAFPSPGNRAHRVLTCSYSLVGLFSSR